MKEAAIAAVMEGAPIPPEFIHDKEVVLAAVLYDGNHLREASTELQNDKEVVLAAVSKDGHALGYASIELRADETIVLAAIKNDPEAFWNAAPTLRTSKEFILQAFMMGDIFDYIDTFYADKDVMMAAVLHNPLYLAHASDELKMDRELVLTAILKNGNAIRCQPSRDPNLLYYASKRGYEPTPDEKPIIQETKDRFMTFMTAAKARRRVTEKSQRVVPHPLERLNAHGPHFASLWKRTIGDFAGQPLKAGRKTRRFYKR
jgi:hypothetical protein